MALIYSLKYKKLNFFQKVLLEKEGEVIIDRQSFRLKGKGAQDTGENIYFGDIRELSMKDEELSFTTLSKEKYVLGNFANLFDSFLKDFMRVRNEFLAESLFMKVGMLYHEYDGYSEIINGFGKNINKGKSRIQFYEGSIVVIPEVREVFVIYPDFLKSHEFDDDEYVLHLYMDNGSTVNISKLGTSFEDAQQTFESLLGNMYGRVINNLKEVLPDLDADTLLKLAYKLKNGRALPFNSLKKMDDDMQEKLINLAFSGNPSAQEKCRHLRKLGGDENFYLGFAFTPRHETHEQVLKSWFICIVPEKNIAALAITSSPEDKSVYFFKIIMQKGDAMEKLPEKLLEIEQMMVLFKGDLSSVYRDRKELRKSRYKTAMKKLSFFRLLRKSFIGKSTVADEKQFESDLNAIFTKAQNQ
jgi:hypothetical protein